MNIDNCDRIWWQPSYSAINNNNNNTTTYKAYYSYFGSHVYSQHSNLNVKCENEAQRRTKWKYVQLIRCNQGNQL